MYSVVIIMITCIYEIIAYMYDMHTQHTHTHTHIHTNVAFCSKVSNVVHYNYDYNCICIYHN